MHTITVFFFLLNLLKAVLILPLPRLIIRLLYPGPLPLLRLGAAIRPLRSLLLAAGDEADGHMMSLGMQEAKQVELGQVRPCYVRLGHI